MEYTKKPDEWLEGIPFKLTKSTFMDYLRCPRLFWWRNVALPDIRMPATPQMVRGRNVHTAAEQIFDRYDGEKSIEAIRALADDSEEESTETLADIILQAIDEWGIEGKPLLHEKKLTVLDEENNILLVGIPDFILTRGNDVIMGELKTGRPNLTSVRKELCFYSKMMKLLGLPEPTHFMVISTDCEDYEYAKSLQAKKREVIFGFHRGFAVLEPIPTRSVNSFNSNYDNFISVMKNGGLQDIFPMKFSDHPSSFCQAFCDFTLSCEQEVNGVGETVLNHVW